ncbi:hypothetical protein N7532_009448 [Penicillium argentinense]|uniref:Uncharacterized protein n=1 Tax=Penicillium argentinense TaxID=1131581 RepID=A0A9W9K2I9_9EURO|nr:uncharacterized protein N7532_009448 [Penicillium argentinense]KAJ5090764.1 hypothetical protein N7532_009448 [Penicillium argentinense]
MAPQKGRRRSLPATPTQITPARRSPRVSSSASLHSGRRRAFEAQPSRLRHSQTVDSLQASAATFTDPDLDRGFIESLEATGWSLDQYLPKSRHPHPSSTSTSSDMSSASIGTRMSGRIRKPSTRALEAAEEQASRPKKWALPKKPATKPEPEPASEPVLLPVSEHTPSPTPLIAPKPTSMDSTKKLAQKPKTIKSSAKQIVASIENRGQQLSESARKAFSRTIKLPSEAAGFLAKVRAQREAGILRPWEARGDLSSINTDTEASESASTSPDPKPEVPTHGRYVSPVPLSPSPRPIAPEAPFLYPHLLRDVPKEKLLRMKLFLKEAPGMDGEDWARAGFSDDGEEAVVSPRGQSPYRATPPPQEENLPLPPLLSRSENEISRNNHLGFPPFFGDRNTPYLQVSGVTGEEITAGISQENATIKRRADEPADEPTAKHQRRSPSPAAPSSVAPHPYNTRCKGKGPAPTKPVRLKLTLKPRAEAKKTPSSQPGTDSSESSSTSQSPSPAADSGPARSTRSQSRKPSKKVLETKKTATTKKKTAVVKRAVAAKKSAAATPYSLPTNNKSENKAKVVVKKESAAKKGNRKNR